jgi:hypothetical protein
MNKVSLEFSETPLNILSISTSELSRDDAALILWKLRHRISRMRKTHSVSMDYGSKTVVTYNIDVNPATTIHLITDSLKSSLAKLYISFDCESDKLSTKRKVSTGCI